MENIGRPGREEAMTHAIQMLETTPQQPLFDRDVLARCIDACFDCAQACTASADACLGEEMVGELTRCIALNEVCADVCATTGAALSRQVAGDHELLRALLEACARSCRSCGDECERHAEMHEHCRVCAEACRDCEQRCRELLAA
jgi:uncharacterized protein DUF326